MQDSSSRQPNKKPLSKGVLPVGMKIEFPPELPISSRSSEIIDLLEKHQTLILAGETGSGKTTQIPKMCLAAGRSKIACTQPRRIAALSISQRVAEELNVEWGGAVGCKIRFSDNTSPETLVKFLTDGMLLSELHGDPMLREYDTIIIDEAHERSLNIDFLLGHLRNLRFTRPDLKIIITSATIDTEAFSKAFDNAPVIQVSGRTYPVETLYLPLPNDEDAIGDDEPSNIEAASSSPFPKLKLGKGVTHYIDAAAHAAIHIAKNTGSGDILVFMPAERDILESIDLLNGALPFCENIPLFGQLSNEGQRRVFARSQKRKIIVATNIAETSITIPGIRYVIDSGLARISRYVPQLRTRRLPIEDIAQSSADQRKGRAGRIEDGTCIRLYSEKDFLKRPRFTQPEIQRANLADVILRMKAFGLGSIERFPFINMPAGNAIRAGYGLLTELGALAQTSAQGEVELTQLGRELARLPIDPTIARMVLQARKEKSLREVLIIASALSIQDPRERPLEKREEAERAHRQFNHPDSDFLTLLNIWESFHTQVEALSHNKLRAFCRKHYLSYLRMREWNDIHSQLVQLLRQQKGFVLSSVHDGLSEEKIKSDKRLFPAPSYRAIHRAILAGLLGNIAAYDDKDHSYKATHHRTVSIFPGSSLFQKQAQTRKSKDAETKPRKSPAWIMAGEIMETARLYARTCARIDPAWVLDLGSHIIKLSYSEPSYNPDQHRVQIKQRSQLYGLPIDVRGVNYGRIDPTDATEIFIREALVNDSIEEHYHPFHAHNRKLIAETRDLLARSRSSHAHHLDELIYRFYARQLLPFAKENPPAPVSSLNELNQHLRRHPPHYLELSADDLLPSEPREGDSIAYPESLPVANHVLPLNYAYKPGDDEDGATLNVLPRQASGLTASALDWSIPGYLPQKIEHYLRALPKHIRRAFTPLQHTANTIAGEFLKDSPKNISLQEALLNYLNSRHRIHLPRNIWDHAPSLPQHLLVRIRVHDENNRTICASRNLDEIHLALAQHQEESAKSIGKQAPDAWRSAAKKHEKHNQTDWTFGDIPHRIHVTDLAGVPIHAYPALKAEKDSVSLILCKSAEDASRLMPKGLSGLLEIQLQKDLAWLQKDLRSLRNLGPLISTLIPLQQLTEDAYLHIKNWLLDPHRLFPALQKPETSLTEDDFKTALSQARNDLRGLVPEFTDLLKEILSLRQQLLVHPGLPKGEKEHLQTLIPPRFLRESSYARLTHFPRYLKAMLFRAERWKKIPAKDGERQKVLDAFWKRLSAIPGESEKHETLRWLLEEFYVSQHAQHLGTPEPVSLKKVQDAFDQQDGSAGKSQAAPRKNNPPPILNTGGKKTLKSLSSLDAFFKK